MSVAENKRSVVVGIFVLIGIVIFVAGILTLGGQQKRFVRSVQVRTIVSDAEGLKTGNNVRFSGVKIGTVKAITFVGDAQVEILLNIDEEAQKYIHKDARVKIGSESLIGNKNITILGGSPQVPAVENGDVLKVEKTLSTEDIMATLQENNLNLVHITTDLKKVTAGLASEKGTLGKLVNDTSMAHNFQQVMANLQKVSVTTARASSSLAQFTSKLNQKEGLANQLLTDTATFRHLKASLAQLEQTTASAKQLTSNLTQASSKLNENNNALGVMLNDPQFAENLKSTMGNLETSSQKFDENMEALQHSVFLKGYFKVKGRKGKDKEKVQK
jgi:phospholipid/cholesterol/gamma-HCH transport system substrate-binding protein